MTSHFNYKNVVTCKLDEKNEHILKEPRILPCGNTACLECIQKLININTSELQCGFQNCNQVHRIENLNELKINPIAENAVNDNLKTLLRDLSDKLKQAYKDAEAILTNKKVDSIFSSMKTEIIKRIKILQDELRRLEHELLQITDDLKEHYLLKTRKEFDIDEKTYKKMIDETTKAIHHAENNNETLRKSLYTCQTYLNEINGFNQTFYSKLDNITFQPANWIPDFNDVGKLTGMNMTKFVMKLIHNNPRVINLENESIHGVCGQYDERLLLSCVDSNKLIVADKHFNVVNQLTKIENFDLNCPLGLCSDRNDSFYLCDLMNHRIIIFDKEFNVKKTIGSFGKGPGEFDRPLDCCYYAGSLYVLDCKNKRIQEFTAEGDFKREIKLLKIGFDISKRGSMILDDDSLHKRPLRLDISEDIIAVIDDYEELFIYNFAGDLKQILKNCRLMCFVDTYLFTCNDNGLVTCYERYKYNEHDEYLPLFKRSVEQFKPPISFMKYINGHLTVTLGGSKRGLALI